MDGLERGTALMGMRDAGFGGNVAVVDAAARAAAFAAPGTALRATLKSSIHCVGIGLHSGRKVSLGLHPARAGSGIVFRRTDLEIDIPARFDHVVDTRLCTVLAHPEHPHARIGTVEHVMAALAGAGVTDVLVTVDGPEAPILDGSANGFAFLIACAGLQALDAPAPVIEVLRSVTVRDGLASATLHPGGDFPGLAASLSIDFAAAAIGRQAMSLEVTPDSFREVLSQARTFTQLQEVEALRGAGLAQGGSLDNAVVVDGGAVLNPGGLRMPDEFVRHKLLDLVGDLALAGAALHARFVGHRNGHALNNRLLRALFADAANWRLALPAAPADAAGWGAQAWSGRETAHIAVAAAPF